MIAYLYHGGLLSFLFSMPLMAMAPRIMPLAVKVIEDFDIGDRVAPLIPKERWFELGKAIEASRPAYADIGLMRSLSDGLGAPSKAP